MSQQITYQTLSNVGVDPSQYYAVSASTTPETPAPPFNVGTRAFGSDGSEFVFVQASTSISLSDFVVVNVGQAPTPYQANSITNTNVASSLMASFGSTGLVVKGSVSFIPAGAYFWVATKGQYLPATTSAGMATTAGGVTLYTSATAGVLTSVTTSSSLAAAFNGIICVNSLTVSIPSSIIPAQGGTQSSTGFTVGPVVNLNQPRIVTITSLTFATASAPIFSF